MLYVPEGFALGYQTLVDDSDVFYAVGTPYAAHAERGLRWDDPAFRIAWPLEPTEISEKDTSHTDFDLSAYRWPEPTQQIAESPA